MPPLSRLLAREEQTCDFLAALCDLDPEPLREWLGLPGGGLTVRREVTHRHAGRTYRMDLVVYLDGRARAMIEVKIAAGRHGDQFDGYEHWRQFHGLDASDCHLVTLAGEDVPLTPAGWRTGLTLPAFLSLWLTAADPHVAWLATQGCDLFAARAAQFDHPLGEATYPEIADLVVKQLVSDFLADRADRVHVHPEVKGRLGADFLAWVPLPGHEAAEDVCLSVELQPSDHRQPGRRWWLRVGVEVEATETRSHARAVTDAHDLALRCQPQLSRSTVVSKLTEAGEADLAAAVLPDPLDGFRGTDTAAAQRWRHRAEGGDDAGLRRSAHPIFYVYWNRRMSSRIGIDVNRLDRHALRRLLQVVLAHLLEVSATAGPGNGDPRTLDG